MTKDRGKHDDRIDRYVVNRQNDMEYDTEYFYRVSYYASNYQSENSEVVFMTLEELDWLLILMIMVQRQLQQKQQEE